MAIQNRRGLDTDFNPNKMLPGEIAVSTDNKKIYVCFEAGTVKRMATHEDFSDMLDAIQNIVETGTQMIDDFEVLAVEKCNINDTDISTLTTFSSKKINDLFNDYYDKNELYNKTEIDEKEELLDDRIIANEDGIKTILGNLASEYSTSQTYAVGDYCIYDSKLYKCTTAMATAETWTSEHWELTDCGSEIKTLNSNLESEISNLTSDISSLMVKRTLTFNATNVPSKGSMYVNYSTPAGYTPVSVKVNESLWWQVSLSYNGYVFLFNTDGVTKNETVKVDIFFVKSSLVKTV